MIVRAFLATAVVAILSIGGAAAQSAKATLKNAEGAAIGSLDLAQVSDGVLVKLTARGLPPGEHAFHVHAVGKCEPPFTTAGGHFNPDNRKHGMMSAEGHHAGDMPNLIVPASGDVAVEVVNTAVTLDKGKPNSLYKPDGTAFVIHAAADDYKTDPTGNAGGRIACAVVE
ncbi:superoxide dismutase family protein [Bradyrhizobium sp. U87765 SZCCT0131]|uniref:superoxide dismutase family protein n=1 Tax=unclassified Bradyrhizobium TaxID=2631580 RepID=UPI001BA7F5E5|nr:MULTISPECIES: superoxide dismutase family protein [unclassified Bradyrhizobium]MBR1216956.1 superoxide dismutase family protein [Bradyrhizobium sp. U87765 SZCCT0131]MBR1259288.1 superoxide dismutase family protein [Bradyrhizobium sp. U87765 SZCCT0134]MBR1305429.1 superoxide dismutase family protein [Bradyrhizobium sp. U87765 SZCCT0110]MBR1321215.1 superoxide dismutase family protein [Bradyrhizobium sp. U87765 SZCCT0109]MBR1350131.1 superoxide dismutase family protein [Bradyrhizobium sp. U87